MKKYMIWKTCLLAQSYTIISSFLRNYVVSYSFEIHKFYTKIQIKFGKCNFYSNLEFPRKIDRSSLVQLLERNLEWKFQNFKICLDSHSKNSYGLLVRGPRIVAHQVRYLITAYNFFFDWACDSAEKSFFPKISKRGAIHSLFRTFIRTCLKCRILGKNHFRCFWISIGILA